MRKVTIFLILVIVILIVVLVILSFSDQESGTAGGFHSSSVAVERTMSDTSPGFVSEFEFSYNTVRTESESFPVKLRPDSRLISEALDADSPCSLALYRGREKTWSAQLSSGENYQPGMEAGEYELILEMPAGSGKGKVVIAE